MNVGIIGGGLMGRETASALARWFALDPMPGPAKVIAVADLHQPTLGWYERVPTITQRATDYRALLDNPAIDVLYVAVPHNLHEQIYGDVIDSGKDLLAEKPFGIDLESAKRLYAKVQAGRSFVRCSSEFPFYPIVQRAYEIARSGGLGTLIKGRCSFLHSSDLDPTKPINWKRQASTCGVIGVMGDLGLHVCHLPFRLGLMPKSVFALLENIVEERPDGKGGMAVCDTWDNATMLADCRFPFTFETKRIAPGEMNTWEFELMGTLGGVRVSTKHPKTLNVFRFKDGIQEWTQTDVGSQSAFKTITGPIFEFGFPDAILQMWASFAAERAGNLSGRFGCATPEEALLSHRLFDAALRSHAGQAVVKL